MRTRKHNLPNLPGCKKAWAAKDKNGIVAIYENKPKKTAVDWYDRCYVYAEMFLSSMCFPLALKDFPWQDSLHYWNGKTWKHVPQKTSKQKVS